MYTIGKNYFIRTVTMIYTGKLVEVTGSDLIIADAAWIADTGRFAQAIATGIFSEVEPYPDGVLVNVNRGAIVDSCAVTWELPRTQK
jgi:hypothetical protein